MDGESAEAVCEDHLFARFILNCVVILLQVEQHSLKMGVQHEWICAGSCPGTYGNFGR